MVRPPSRGRQRTDPTLPIEPLAKRQTSFCKTKKAFLEACIRYSLRYGKDIAVVVFSEGGHAFGLGEPSIDAVLSGTRGEPSIDAVLRSAHGAQDGRGELRAAWTELQDLRAVVEAAKGGRPSWWEADVELLGEEELPEFVSALKRLRGNLSRLSKEAATSSTPPPPPLPPSAPDQ